MSYYVQDAFDPAKRTSTIDRVVNDLKLINFDTILVRGVSGLLVGPVVAYLLNKNIAVVRKDSESSHAGCKVSGVVSGRCIILDDFISSGATVREIIKVFESLRLGYLMNEDQRQDESQIIGFYGWDASVGGLREAYHNRCGSVGIAFLNPLNGVVDYTVPGQQPEPVAHAAQEYAKAI